MLSKVFKEPLFHPAGHINVDKNNSIDWQKLHEFFAQMWQIMIDSMHQVQHSTSFSTLPFVENTSSTNEVEDLLSTQQQLFTAMAQCHDAQNSYQCHFDGFSSSVLLSLEQKIQLLMDEGQSIETTNELLSYWVESSEEVYAKFVMTNNYSLLYGKLINAKVQVKKKWQAMIDELNQLMNVSSQTDMTRLEKELKVNNKKTQQLEKELAELKALVNKMMQND